MVQSVFRTVGKSVAVLAVGVLVCLQCGCIHEIKRLFVDPDPVDSAVVAEWWDGPKIRPGVRLEIQIGTTGLEPVQAAVLVDQKGDVTLQHLLEKPVHCDGMTLEELKKELVKRYSVYYRQPQVTVTFAPYDGTGVSPWGTVTVLGEVGNPGPVNMPPTMDLTITKILQAAGGVKQYADRTKIRVSRCDRNGKQQRMIVDLNEIGQDGRPDKDIVLRAGDVVWVPETWY